MFLLQVFFFFLNVNLKNFTEIFSGISKWIISKFMCFICHFLFLPISMVYLFIHSFQTLCIAFIQVYVLDIKLELKMLLLVNKQRHLIYLYVFQIISTILVYVFSLLSFPLALFPFIYYNIKLSILFPDFFTMKVWKLQVVFFRFLMIIFKHLICSLISLFNSETGQGPYQQSVYH